MLGSERLLRPLSVEIACCMSEVTYRHFIYFRAHFGESFALLLQQSILRFFYGKPVNLAGYLRFAPAFLTGLHCGGEDWGWLWFRLLHLQVCLRWRRRLRARWVCHGRHVHTKLRVSVYSYTPLKSHVGVMTLCLLAFLLLREGP